MTPENKCEYNQINENERSNDIFQNSASALLNRKAVLFILTVDACVKH